MDTKTIVMCVVALILGMLMANMLKSVCGCKTVEGSSFITALPYLVDDETEDTVGFKAQSGEPCCAQNPTTGSFRGTCQQNEYPLTDGVHLCEFCGVSEDRDTWFKPAHPCP